MMLENHPLKHTLNDLLPELRKVNSTEALLAHPVYKQREGEFRRVLDGFVSEQFAQQQPSRSPYYRVCSWNVERGLEFDGLLHFLRNHDVIAKSDIIVMTETDFGMARTSNRDIARDFAKELGMNYAFAPCYMNLDKGSGLEAQASGANEFGLHGNAILSRYPIKDVRAVRLRNGKDKMRGKEKRIGSQQAVVCTVSLPDGDVRVAGFHLDAHSSQAHRRGQLRTVLDAVEDMSELPTILGGDWNTSTYNSSKAVHAIIGFWIRVFMGVRNVVKNHYPYPDRLFERKMFRMLKRRGYDYESVNAPGACTVHYDVGLLKARENLGDWVPGWCFKFIDWALQPTGGKCSFKLDWFAAKGIQLPVNGNSLPPTVLHDLSFEGREVSDHDPIVLDFILPEKR